MQAPTSSESETARPFNTFERPMSPLAPAEDTPTPARANIMKALRDLAPFNEPGLEEGPSEQNSRLRPHS